MHLQWDANHGPSNARLNRPAGGGKAGAWSARKNDLKQWIQVNFRELTRVTKVVIQGRQDYAQWVTKFKLSYSLDGNHFEHQEKVRNEFIQQNKRSFYIYQSYLKHKWYAAICCRNTPLFVLLFLFYWKHCELMRFWNKLSMFTDTSIFTFYESILVFGWGWGMPLNDGLFYH